MWALRGFFTVYQVGRLLENSVDLVNLQNTPQSYLSQITKIA